jgi:lysophospholipid acyltransferase (LPLAT)-like uncharacterized protein
MSIDTANRTSSRAGAPRRGGGVIVPHEPSRLQRAAARVLYTCLCLLEASLRYRWKDRSGLDGVRQGEPAIYSVWHNRLALCLFIYYANARKANATNGVAAIVSASRDGGFLTAVLRCFRVEPVRGSSSRRGPQALRELTSWAAKGYDLAITPDGPRGPRYVVQEGIMAMAQLTGLPIVPFSYHVRWKICLKSWDGFQIPLPFSVVELNSAPIIRVPREATDEEREQLRLKLQNLLKDLSKD